MNLKTDPYNQAGVFYFVTRIFVLDGEYWKMRDGLHRYCRFGR